MAPQKKDERIDSEEAFNEQYSRFKVWISFKDGRNKSFYGREKNASMLQIISGRVSTVTFDRQKGYESCIYLAEKYKAFAGKYKTAIVYDRTKPDREIRKYINGNLESYEEVHFTEEDRYDHFVIKRKDGIPVLVPSNPGIDFKQEVRNALYKNEEGNKQ